MKKTDWAIIALNLFTAFVTFICATEGGEEAVVAFMAVAAMTAINVTFVARRARSGGREPGREPDELDARTILDLDARLEALERAQTDAADAERWRRLVASGQVSGPAAEEAQDTPGRHQPARNGLG